MKTLLIALVFYAVFPLVGQGAVRIQASPTTLARYDLYQLDFQAPGVGAFQEKPGLKACIVTPDGKVLTLDAFWTREFSLSYKRVVHRDEASGEEVTQQQEIPTAAANPHWRVRFTPNQVGVHRIRLLVGRNLLWQGRFTVTPRSHPGFLRAAPANHNYLQFDDGTGFFALGFNVCWPPSEQGVKGYIHYLDRLKAAGCNYTRLWLCTWGLRLEEREPYHFNLAAAWQLDAIFSAAAERKIYLKLCLDNFYDFNNNPDKGPYLGDGGICSEKTEFFTSRQARQIYLARLNYLVARYSAFTSLYAWELWNEINYVLPESSLRPEFNRKRFVLPWIKDVAAVLRHSDPYHHLITSSLGMNEHWPGLWSMKDMDIVQLHSYIHYLPDRRQPGETDGVELLRGWHETLKVYRKPTLLAEYGYVGTNEHNPLNGMDRDGVALHNGLWAATFLGYSGTPMLWWWDYYLEKYQLYYHYQALSRFLEGVDWSQPKRSLMAGSKAAGVRVLVLFDHRWAGLWIQDAASTWQNRVEFGRSPRMLEGVAVTLKGLTSGTYRLQWVNTLTGNGDTPTEVRVGAAGQLLLAVPSFKNDIAARLTMIPKLLPTRSKTILEKSITSGLD